MIKNGFLVQNLTLKIQKEVYFLLGHPVDIIFIQSQQLTQLPSVRYDFYTELATYTLTLS